MLSAVALALAAAGCAAGGGADGRESVARPAACPAGPVRVERSGGGETAYLGTVPGRPELCRMVRPDGAGVFVFGVWRSDWPGAGEALPALRVVIEGGAGASASFDTHAGAGRQYHDSYRNEGTEVLVVGGRRFVALVLAHEREGFGGNFYHSVITSWRDVASGVTLKAVERQIAGESYGAGATWVATAVE